MSTSPVVSNPVVPPFTRIWDLRLISFLTFILVMSFVIPQWHASYQHARYWNWWTLILVLLLGIAASYVLSSKLKWRKLTLPPYARTIGVIATVSLIAANAWRIHDLVIKVRWFDAQSVMLTGAPYGPLGRAFGSKCKADDQTCKVLDKYREAVAKNTQTDLEKQAAQMSPSDMKAATQQAQQTPQPQAASLRPSTSNSVGICQSSQFGACAISGIVAIGCLILSEGDVPDCLLLSSAIYGLLGQDKDANGLSAASTANVGATLRNLATQKDGNASDIVSPLKGETDPKAIQVTERVVQKLQSDGKLSPKRGTDLLAALQQQEVRSKTPLVALCRQRLINAANPPTPGTNVDWCAVSSVLKGGECSRASMAQQEAQSMLMQVVRDAVQNDAAKVAQITQTLSTCPSGGGQ